MEDRKYKNWMFTWNSIDTNTGISIDRDDFEEFLTKFCKLYVFQTERVTRTHIQGYFETTIRKRKDHLLRMFKEFAEEQEEKGGSVCIKQLTLDPRKGSREEAITYCTKTESQLEAPRTFGIKDEYQANDLQIFNDKKKWYPWQILIFDMLVGVSPSSPKKRLKAADDRSIIWIVDEAGNSGKSKFVKNMCYNLPEEACKLAFGSSTQLRSACVKAGPRELYFMDIPRTLGRDDSINDIMSVAEDIKNGFVTTSMYGEYQMMMFDPPHVVIFSNFKPNKQVFSNDRWQIYEINYQKNLIKI